MQSPEVVRLEHETAYAANLVMLQWSLGNTCNFACSYCPIYLHDGSVRPLELDRVLKFCDRFIAAYQAPGRTLLIEFTGGEATMYRDYVALVKYLRERGVKVALSSNGGRTIRFWEEVVPYLDHANITFHSEFTDEEHFLAVIGLLKRAGLTVHSNIMMLPERFDRCVAVAERLAATIPDVSIALQALRHDIGNAMYPYSPAQLDTLAHKELPVRWTGAAKQVSKGKMVEIFSDGTRAVVEPHLLVTTGRNRWPGWECRAGLDELVVDYDGGIWAGWCKVGGPIGNVLDDEIVFPTQPLLCDKPTCDCTLDLMNYREKPRLALPVV